MTAIPTWDQFMAPALRVLSDGEVHKARWICNAVADELGVTDEQRAELIPSGQPRYLNRSLWALSYLSRADAAERPKRGHYRITDAGRELLAAHPEGITEHDLREMPSYVSPRETRATSPAAAPGEELVESTNLSPSEQVEEGIARLSAEVAADLLSRLHANEPAFFEQAVLDLLIAMGYGGAEGHATRTQLSNDGGIDGIVDQDALGLSRIYVQAKRYALDAAVGRPEIQAFVGALHGNQANQGVFITTARFSRGAQDYAGSVPTRVVLIDGARLASLMIRYGVGVQTKRTVNIVEVDEDFFE
ncbi:MAG TPA: restriction endonuclease [Ruania sp.]|nr:restriction endonuclease [Ruania sp.]